MAIANVNWDGTPKTCAAFTTVCVSVSGLTGNDTIAVYGSLDNSVFTVLSGANLSDNLIQTGTSNTISANGIYSYPATGYVKYIKTGNTSTTTVNVLMKR